MENLFWIGFVGAFLALGFAVIQAKKVLSFSEGTEQMQKIAAAIRSGANAYLKRQYTTVLKVFAVVFVLLLAIVVRCLLVARDAATPMESYVCVGMAGMLIFQTIANIGMCLFLMPVIGLTLPFFSYGGSSIVTLFAAMGIVSGVKKRSRPEWLTN